MRRSTFLRALLFSLLAGRLMAAERRGFPAMQGNWRVLSAEKGNRELTAEERAPLRVVIAGKELKLLSDGKMLFTATLELPGKPDARAIDFTITEPDPSKSRGIHEFKDGKLRLCWDNRGGERPSTFIGMNESGSLVLLLLERVAP